MGSIVLEGNGRLQLDSPKADVDSGLLHMSMYKRLDELIWFQGQREERHEQGSR